jgi:hypothetical protein
MQTWALMYAHPAILEEIRRRGVHPWIFTGRQTTAPDAEGQVTVIAVARLRWPEKRLAASASTRSPTVRRADAGSGRGGIVPVPLPQSVRTFA